MKKATAFCKTCNKKLNVHCNFPRDVIRFAEQHALYQKHKVHVIVTLHGKRGTTVTQVFP